MAAIDIPYICTAIANLAGVPVRAYQNDEPIFFYFYSPLTIDPMSLYKDALWKIDASVGYYLTDDLSYYGIVNARSYKIILGPTRQIENTDQELKNLAFRLNVPANKLDEFLFSMKSIVRLPFESILQMLCVINHSLSGEKLELKDISLYEEDLHALKTTQAAQQLETGPLSDRTDYPHTTLAIEQTIMDIVRLGDTAALREYIKTAPAVRGGVLAAEQLRQRKNIFIVSTTLASRAAIQGGLDTETALSLSDVFIQNCELLTSPDRITTLQYHMILEYTERVERIRKGKTPTKLALTIANYVQHHLSEPIKVESIANELYMSRPYLSRKFKEETGQSLTDFILKEKTEEAKRLLRYTDKSAAQIGTYLGFSSPAHFSKVFRKYTETSPLEYRESQ